MNPYSLAVAGSVIVEAWLLALVALRGKRPWLQATFGALALTFVLNGVAFIGTTEGMLSPAWESAVLWTLVLAHPLMAILVLSLIHGETVPRRRPAVLALLALAPVVVLLTPSADWGVQHAYEPNLLGAFLIGCLGIGLAESVYERITSALFAADSFWLALGVVALIIGGPFYTVEFEDLGLAQAAGSNLAAPIALVAFALVLFHADPFPSPPGRLGPRWSGPRSIEAGPTFVFEESRPKYALHLAKTAAQRGQPTLVVAREGWPPEPDGPGPALALLTPTRHAALRTLASAAEFCARAPGGLVVLPDLADVAMMSGWPRTREAVGRLRVVCRDTRSTVVLSTSRLTAAEREGLQTLHMEWWALPDPVQELEAVLSQSFGPGAGTLLESFARARGLRREDLGLDHVDAIVQFLDRALSELGGTAADAAANQGLRSQAEAAAQGLREYASLGPAELARGDWPSRISAGANRGIVVTAAEYWKGKEMEELFEVARDLGDREPLFERARSVFVEQLGDAGEGVLRSEISKLGKRPEELRPEDVARLADRASVDLAAMAEVVDLPQEQVRIRSQIESIRRRLEAIAGDQS